MVKYSARIVDILLNCNAKITCAKGSEMTPLHMAVKQTSAEYTIEQVVEALLARQTAAANVNSKDTNMQTPLHYAAEYCSDRPHVTELLLSRYVEKRQFQMIHLLLYCSDYSLIISYN